MPESALFVVSLCIASFLQLPRRVALGVHFAASLAIFTRPITTGPAPVARIPVVMEAKMKYLTEDISPRQAAASACRAEEWFVLAVQQLNSFCRDGEVREPEMSKAEWKISQVEKLIGLSRRDIQRACYKGRGGVAILQPKDSSWGRRNYSLEDVATLFVVKCHKERGLSLVEIKRVFERSEASEGGCAMLEDQVSLMLDRRDELERQIACGRLLVAATKGRTPLRKLVRSYVMKAVVDAASVQEQSGANVYFALLQRCVLISAGEVDELEKSIRKWLDKGERPDAECVQGFLRKEFERTARLVGESTQAGVARALGEVLNSPSMEPTLELWLGPGSYEFIDEALNVALAAKA